MAFIAKNSADKAHLFYVEDDESLTSARARMEGAVEAVVLALYVCEELGYVQLALV